MRRRTSPRAMAFLIGLLLAVSGVLGLSAGSAQAADVHVDLGSGRDTSYPEQSFHAGDAVVFDNPSADEVTVRGAEFATVVIPAGGSAAVQPTDTTGYTAEFFEDFGGIAVPATRGSGTLTKLPDDSPPSSEPTPPVDPSPTGSPSPDPTTEPTSGPTTDPTTEPTSGPTSDPTTGPGTGSTTGPGTGAPTPVGTPTTVPDPVTGQPIPATIVDGVVIPLPSGAAPASGAPTAGPPAAGPEQGGGTEPEESTDPEDGFVSQATDFLLTAGGLVQPSSPRRWGVPIVLAVVLLAGVGSLVVRVVRSTRGRRQ